MCLQISRHQTSVLHHEGLEAWPPAQLSCPRSPFASALTAIATGRNRRSPIRSISPSGDGVSQPKPRRLHATGYSGTFPCLGLQASFSRTTTHRNASRNGSARSANGHSSCVVPPINIGCMAGPGVVPSRPIQATPAQVFEQERLKRDYDNITPCLVRRDDQCDSITTISSGRSGSLADRVKSLPKRIPARRRMG
jgi:hypothetical protein